MRRLSWGGVPLLCALALAGCGRGAGLEGDKVLALVNGNAITEATLQKEVEALPPYVRPIVDSPAGRAQFLESLITRDLLMQEALRRGIERRKEVRDRLEMARRSIILEALLREVAENAPGLSDAALRKYYEANKANFETGERVAVRHMLFKEKERADAIAARARGGEPFEKLSAEARTGQGENSADLGLIEQGRFIKEFERAAFSAAAGSVVGPVRTVYGYHVLWVGEKKPAGIATFEEVRDRIASELREQAQRDAFEQLVAGLKKQADIRVTARLPRPEPAAGAPLPHGSAPGAGEPPRTPAGSGGGR